jgi:DNA-binding beta-propeller fold protein YncE
VYVATELESAITVVDAVTNQAIRKIGLNYRVSDYWDMVFNPRGLVVAPDGKSVWVAAPIPWSDCPDEEGGGSGEGPNLPPNAAEAIIVLDTQADTILARIPVPSIDGNYVHISQITIDRDSRYAYVIANGSSQIVRVDVQTREIMGRVDLGANRDPQGVETCEDRLLVANGAGRSLSVVDATRGTAEEVPLDGLAIRAVCSGDARFAYVTLYDTREIARYEFATGGITRMPLPKQAIGPTQLALTRDGRRLYVLDQGTVLNRPAGDKLYELDPQTGAVRAAITVGRAPRGLVLSEDGKTAYTSNYYDAGISVVDLVARRTVATVPTGIAPNGIGVWQGGVSLIP